MPVASVEQATDEILRRVGEDVTASRARLRAELVHQTRIARAIEDRPRRPQIQKWRWITIDGKITAQVIYVGVRDVIVRVVGKEFMVPRADLARHFTYIK